MIPCVRAQQNICLFNARPAASQGTERRGEGNGGGIWAVMDQRMIVRAFHDDLHSVGRPAAGAPTPVIVAFPHFNDRDG